MARAGNLNPEVKGMVRGRKDPSSAAVSAASMKGNAGPKQKYGGGKRTSQNQQYKKTTWNNIVAVAFGATVIFEDPFQHKCRICRALGNSSHQVPVPIGSVRDIHPHPVSFFGKLLLALRSDAVQHLEFKLLPGI